MKYELLVDSYESERVKVLSVWSEFTDETCRCGRGRTTRADAACTNTWCT
jgi:hypothetical protein